MKNHVFVISDDVIHKNSSVHEVQELWKSYLTKDVGQQVTMHELTNGCSVQYKSRHCPGDLSSFVTDFGYKKSATSSKCLMQKENRIQLGQT